MVVNRSENRARELVLATGAGAPFEMRAAALDHAAVELADADVVLTAVAAEAHVLGEQDFASVTAPLLVIDLGVPRNVDPAVGSRPEVTLLDMDTLSARWWTGRSGTAPRNRSPPRPSSTSRWSGSGPPAANAGRPRSSPRCALASNRCGWPSSSGHRAQLADLSEDEWEQVDQTTRAALAKMLHEPTMLLKETAGTPRGERLVEALRILFDL